ncbi:MAG: hypothetical protein ACXW1W_08070 [Methylococcaceae bacterium]
MDIPNLLTVRQFVDKHHAFTNGGIRSLIFNADTNGLADSGALVRVGGKVLLDEGKYFGVWIPLQNKKAAA